MKTTIDDSGRIQLPEDLQARLGVKPGDEVVLEERSGEWIIRPASTTTGLCWEGDVLVHQGTSAIGIGVEEVIDEMHEQRLHQLAEGTNG